MIMEVEIQHGNENTLVSNINLVGKFFFFFVNLICKHFPWGQGNIQVWDFDDRPPYYVFSIQFCCF